MPSRAQPHEVEQAGVVNSECCMFDIRCVRMEILKRSPFETRSDQSVALLGSKYCRWGFATISKLDWWHLFPCPKSRPVPRRAH
jgi:hypothetical protein